MHEFTAQSHETDDTMDWQLHMLVLITPYDNGAERLRAENLTAVSVDKLVEDEYLNQENLNVFDGMRLIIVDNADITRDIIEPLAITAKSITLMKLPGQENGDVAAWLERPGNTIDQLLKLCEISLEKSPSPVPAVTPALPATSGMSSCCDLDGYHGPTLACPSLAPTGSEVNVVRVLAECCEDGNGKWFRLIAFTDRDGHDRETLIPMSWFTTPDKIAKMLLDLGCMVPSNKKERERLLDLLYTTEPDGPTRTLVTMIGWHGSSFVLPGRVIGPGKDRILFNGSACDVAQKGTLGEWREKIGNYCIGNSRLVIAASLAFVGPLLQLLGMENAGIHINGKNGKGKSTALFVATSVISGRNYCRSWRVTVNGLEHLGAEHNNLSLFLDELGQLTQKEAGHAVYTIGNAFRKTRKNGNKASNLPPFSLSYLSSGELSLDEYMKAAGKKAMGGQNDRLIDIPAEPENGFGVYENLHEFPSGEALSDHLRLQTAHCYGTPLIAYLERLTQELEESKKFVTEKMHEFHQTFVPEEDKANIARIARRFAVIAAAGELATRFGVTGWPAGEAMRCAGICFEAWFSATNGMPRHHYRDKLFAFLEAHGSMRFCTAGDNPADVANCAGFRRPIKDGGTEYFIKPKTFRDEIFSKFVSRRVCDELAAQGFLNKGKNSDHNTRLWTPPGGNKASRWYHIVIGESDTL